MSSKLLEKLKLSQKDAKKSIKRKLNPNSAFTILTDEEIALVLALRAKNLRISQNIKQSELSKNANLSSPTTYSNFEQKGTVSLLNFIKIMRSFARVNELENLLQQTVAMKIEELQSGQKKRVR
ncbi:hypothetical protein KJ870_05565 [bacterium]|jgi:AraC-like DNA-binding protein|nr:hypothetical protein [bacterium]MBU1434387.1 hypothetical protein [bacterium]MBU1501965.1 hypothetical protein [bacterium]